VTLRHVCEGCSQQAIRGSSGDLPGTCGVVNAIGEIYLQISVASCVGLCYNDRIVRHSAGADYG